MNESEGDSGDWGVDNAVHLAQRVRLFFNHGPLRGLRLIEVDVIGGTVVLRGQVATSHQKQLATEIARKVAGVGEVRNYLQVHDGWRGEKVQQSKDVRLQARENEAANRRMS